jgi:uncharacterized protein YgbK (DUF1537 family)
VSPITEVPSRLECLLLADDLTGACDAAVHFAERGRRTAVAPTLHHSASGVEVWAVNTDSRNLEPGALAERIAEARDGLPTGPDTILFKKIDSTLRGNAGLEAMEVLKAFRCDLAIFTPALPAMGRVVERGRLRVLGNEAFTPIEIPAWFAAQGVRDCVHPTTATLAEAAGSGARLLSLDAICDGDLDCIVAEARALNRRILWVGSAGLASALARALPKRTAEARPGRAVRGPVVFGIGSTHAVTLAQQQALTSGRPVLRIACTEAAAEPLAAALRDGQHVWLDLPRGQVAEEAVRRTLAGAPAAALALSGGDTASLICRALSVDRIEIEHELLPGIPRGRLRGGLLNGMAVVTKSGGFGAPDALIQVADYFACPKS